MKIITSKTKVKNCTLLFWFLRPNRLQTERKAIKYLISVVWTQKKIHFIKDGRIFKKGWVILSNVFVLNQRPQTCDPRASCGPWEGPMRPAKGYQECKIRIITSNSRIFLTNSAPVLNANGPKLSNFSIVLCFGAHYLLNCWTSRYIYFFVGLWSQLADKLTIHSIPCSWIS